MTLAFLPATFVIWFAAVRSLSAVRPLLATALSALTGLAAGLLIAATVGFSFYTLLLAQEGDPTVLDTDQGSGRAVPLGVPARFPKLRHTHHQRKRWRSVLLHQRHHHQYRGRHQHRSPCGRIPGDAVGRKIPSDHS